MSTSRTTNPARVPESRQGMLKITEIFYSLQGEARDVGRPTVFIRLTGCPLRCVYCDSEYAFHGGEWMHIDQIMEQTAAYGAGYVCVTGGEPLAQKRCLELLERLCDAGYNVSLETSGAIDISHVDERVSRVVDIKTPDSGEVERNLWSNLDVLTPHDQLKFVVCSREDYDWAVAEIRSRGLEENLEEESQEEESQSHESQHESQDTHVSQESQQESQDTHEKPDIHISPVWGQVDPTELAGWVLQDRLNVRLQLQLHKLLWGDAPGK